MELDTSKKKAEMEGCTTRADGIRYMLVLNTNIIFSSSYEDRGKLFGSNFFYHYR